MKDGNVDTCEDSNLYAIFLFILVIISLMMFCNTNIQYNFRKSLLTSGEMGNNVDTCITKTNYRNYNGVITLNITLDDCEAFSHLKYTRGVKKYLYTYRLETSQLQEITTFIKNEFEELSLEFLKPSKFYPIMYDISDTSIEYDKYGNEIGLIGNCRIVNSSDLAKVNLNSSDLDSILESFIIVKPCTVRWQDE